MRFVANEVGGSFSFTNVEVKFHEVKFYAYIHFATTKDNRNCGHKIPIATKHACRSLQNFQKCIYDERISVTCWKCYAQVWADFLGVLAKLSFLSIGGELLNVTFNPRRTLNPLCV